jgi:hypothetical protein
MDIPRKEYTLSSFKEAIIKNYDEYLEAAQSEKRKKELKILCLLVESKFWKDIFNQYGESEDYGEVTKYTFQYEDEDKEKRNAVYYIFFDTRNYILYLFTNVSMDVFSRTMDFYIQRHGGIYYLWISPLNFSHIKGQILEKYPHGKITKFIAKRISYDSIGCEIRPENGRTIIYWGEDGKETLREMQFYYGVLPTHIVFSVDIDLENEMKFKITNESIFTLITSNEESFELFFNLIEYLIPEILKIKSLMGDLKFEYKEIENDIGVIQIPSFESAQIQLTKEINSGDIENLINGLSEENISIVDELMELGSVNFSATVVDDYKGGIFGISANEDQITLIPKYKTSFDSFLKFYRFIIENLDQNAKIKRSSELYG